MKYEYRIDYFAPGYEIMLGWNENGDGYVWPGLRKPDPMGSLETYETWIPGRYTFCSVAHGALAQLYAESDSIKELC